MPSALLPPDLVEAAEDEEVVAERRGEHVHAEAAEDEEVVKAAAADEEEAQSPRPQISRPSELLRDDDVATPGGPGSTDLNLEPRERSSPEEAREAAAAIIELAAAAAEAAREAARAARRGEHIHAQAAEGAREAARAAKAADGGVTPQKLSTARVKPGNPVRQPILGNPVGQPILGNPVGQPILGNPVRQPVLTTVGGESGAPRSARATQLRPPSPSSIFGIPSPSSIFGIPPRLADVEDADAGAKGSLLPPIFGSLLPPEYYTSIGLTKVSGDALSWVIDPNLVVDSVKAGETRTKAGCEDSVKAGCEDSVKAGGDGGDAEAGREGNGGDAEAGREGEGDLPNMGDETSRSAAVWQWLASTNASMASWWARGARDGAASAASDTAAEGAVVSAEGAHHDAETDGHGETSRARLGSQPSPVPALPPALFTVPWMSLPAWYDGEGLPNWGLVLGGPPPPVLEEVTALCRSSIRRCWLDLCGQVIASPCH